MAAKSDIISFKLTSPDFKWLGAIPEKFTCDGEDISPKLEWEDAPEGTRSFALLVEDPDAPQDEPFVHWVIYNIPAGRTELERNIKNDEAFTDGIHQGYNSFDRVGYNGPCPPKKHGNHHYHFILYALNRRLDIGSGASKFNLIDAMEGHILGKAELIGLYRRS